MGHDCNVLDHINTSIQMFKADFNQLPECLLVGPDVAVHLWEHIKEGILKEKSGRKVPESMSDLKENFRFNGLEVRIVAIEGLCTFPLPYSQVNKFFRIINGTEINSELN